MVMHWPISITFAKAARKTYPSSNSNYLGFFYVCNDRHTGLRGTRYSVRFFSPSQTRRQSTARSQGRRGSNPSLQLCESLADECQGRALSPGLLLTSSSYRMPHHLSATDHGTVFPSSSPYPHPLLHFCSALNSRQFTLAELVSEPANSISHIYRIENKSPNVKQIQSYY